MKLAALALLLAAPALAQAPVSAPRFTLDTPIETIAADPAGKAVLQADFPGMLDHPSYPDFKANSLAQTQPMSQGQMTDAQMAKAKDDLAKIK